jgi:hypothetical protein
MLRTVLLVVALLVLVTIGLVYTGVLGLQQKDDGSVKVMTNSVEFSTEPRTVQVPVVRTVPAEPAPVPTNTQ